MPTIWADLSVPKAEHQDIVAAKQGDAGARYRVMMRARMDPGAHRRALDELANGLSERWRQRPYDAVAERAAWALLENDELVRIDV